MEKKSEKGSILCLILVLVGIAAVVGAVVYWLSMRRMAHKNREKWKDYDECGLV